MTASAADSAARQELFGRATLAIFFAVVAALGLWVYSAALRGPFLSDDSFLVVELGRLYALDPQFVVTAFDPLGELKYTLMNYAPLLALFNRLEWALFGQATGPYHVVNVVLHAVNATLFVRLLSRSGLSTRAAVLVGLLFAAHPANVEAVAWISQSRTLLAMTCSLLAFALLPHRPWLATGAFTCGLLFKAAAVVCVPVAFVCWWVSRGDEGAIALRWPLVWSALFALFAVPQFAAFEVTGLGYESPYADFAEQVHSIGSIATHYLVMALTTYGLSPFAQPEVVTSWRDPWWLASLPLAAVIGWRIVHTLARRRIEAAYWCMALSGFAPISQIFPFYYSMADRYLYFILPGLLGGAALWLDELAGRARRGAGTLRSAALLRAVGHGTAGLAVVVVLLFGVASGRRAALWQSLDLLFAEAARNHPESGVGHYMQGVLAVREGDNDRAMRHLRAVVDSGAFRYHGLFTDPRLVGYLRQRPDYQALQREVARKVIEGFRPGDHQTQRNLRHLASAYSVLGRYDEAKALTLRALELPGPHRASLIDDLARINRARLDALEPGAGESPP